MNNNLKREVYFEKDTIIIEDEGMYKLLTSKYNLKAEEKRFIKKIDKNLVNQVLMIFGLGLGNWIFDEQIQEYLKNNKIVVIEPIKKISDRFFEKFENKNIENICIINEYDENSLYLVLDKMEYNSKNINIIEYGNYYNFFEDEYLKILEIIRNLVVDKVVEENTLRSLNKDINKNFLRNSLLEKEFYSINSLKNKYKNVPALVISAGPSLTKQLEKIKGFNGIIISGGRTLKLLEELDIKVDYFVSIDPSIEVYYLIEDAVNSDIPLVTMLNSSADIVKKYKGKNYIFRQLAETKIFENGENIKDLFLGGSVANTSWDLANYMGCSPIVAIGQDLAYTEGKHHAEAACNEKTDKDLNTEATIKIKVNAYNGGKIETNGMFLKFLKAFENYIEYWKNFKDTEYINCTEGGAKIKGTIQMPFEEYLKSRYNKKIIRNSSNIEDIKLELKKDYSNKLEKEIDKTLELIKEAQKYSKEIEKNFYKQNKNYARITKLLEKLDCLDKKFLEIENAFLFYILKATIQEFNLNLKNRNVTIENEEKTIVESNIKLYNELYEKVNAVKNEFVKVKEGYYD